MTDPTLPRCPACDSARVDEGTSRAPQYPDGIWIGCTKCGFSISGPDHNRIRAAWAAVTRSTKLKELRNG